MVHVRNRAKKCQVPGHHHMKSVLHCAEVDFGELDEQGQGCRRWVRVGSHCRSEDGLGLRWILTLFLQPPSTNPILPLPPQPIAIFRPPVKKAPQSSNPIKVQQCPTTLSSLLHPQPLPSLLQHILQHQPWSYPHIGELYILTYKDVANLTYLVAPHDHAEEWKKVSC